MSENLFVKIVRAGVSLPIANNLPIQLDKLSSHEASTFQGADPHFTYRVITTMLPFNDPQLVLYRDHVVDLNTIDAVTKTNRTFLIVGEPQMHAIACHWEWVCTRMRGT